MSHTQRTTHTTLVVAALLLAMPTTAEAQADTSRSKAWEVRVTSGSLIPIGEQRQQLARGPLTTVQVSWLPRRALAVTGTLGWAKSKDLTAVGSRGLNAFAADVGIESRPQRLVVGQRISFSPLAGIGAGARSYDYRGGDSNARYNVAAFIALGGELGYRRLGLRMEARQYVSGFAPMDGVGPTPTRGDVMLLTSLRFNRRAAAHR